MSITFENTAEKIPNCDQKIHFGYNLQASEEIVKQNSPASNLAQNYGRIMATIAEKTSAKL